MKEKDPNKYTYEVFNDYVADKKDSLKGIIRDIESPIEQLLFGSLLGEAMFEGFDVIIQGRSDGLFLGHNNPEILKICPQYQIGSYRVDFYLEYRDLSIKTTIKLIIECDGHDFHEKTKEQAQRDKKRDRKLQGIAPVFRFTGSEIYKSSDDCARQIIEFLMKDTG